MERNYIYIAATALIFLVVVNSSTSSSSRRLVKRQGPPILDLVPPPALSASFPTLRPRNPNPNAFRAREQPPRDLVPPPLNSSPGASPFSSNKARVPLSTSTEYPVLPPLEIPPEKPLTDAEIQQTIQGVRDTSFIPTTGQGATQVGKTADLTLAQASPPVPSSQKPVANNSTSSSNVRFPNNPSDPPSSQVPSSCPICECTSEVDYICANNGVLYLNSCSFDCATFCHQGLQKAPLESCASHNSIK